MELCTYIFSCTYVKPKHFPRRCRGVMFQSSLSANSVMSDIELIIHLPYSSEIQPTDASKVRDRECISENPQSHWLFYSQPLSTFSFNQRKSFFTTLASSISRTHRQL
ncbi:hypothetical protein CRM22_010883 [Opisthorchis felineus]|uniref:Uncharacterized protein n=1 Tax=Opisthorchis felineus TaxID=147828 RepID=A0A4S2KK72_OPIFE|nr:hypothetical protein CRM22_010883 [Opisthorchis felineus]